MLRKLLACYFLIGPIVATAEGPQTVVNVANTHFDGNRYYNDSPIQERNLFDVFKWWLEGGKKAWPVSIENKASPQIPSVIEANKIYVSYVNHASFLVQISGLNILTDPIYSERASPLSWIGPKRRRKPGIAFDKLPHIDYVIISHNHYDHFDLPTLKELVNKFQPQFIVPLGNAKLLSESGSNKIHELDWWQSINLSPQGGTITLVPSQHWSARGIFDRSKSLWGGYVITKNTWKILFQGDTGYGPFFKKIQKRFGSFDLSILPIGAYEPRWFMKDHHMNPDDAVQAHLDLNSHRSLASHFETFQLTNEAIDEPPRALNLSLEKRKLSKDLFRVPMTGETIVFQKAP